jgi:hypothetical protein
MRWKMQRKVKLNSEKIEEMGGGGGGNCCNKCNY